MNRNFLATVLLSATAAAFAAPALAQVADAYGGVELQDADATLATSLDFSHVYVFDRVFSEVTLTALATVLARSSWLVMISSKAPKVWWACGLRKATPVARLRFVTTGKERCTCYVYVNAHFAPGAGATA